MDSIIIFGAKYLIVFLPVLALWLVYKSKRSDQIRIVATIILGGILGYLIAKIGSSLYYDPRPFVSQHVQPLIAHAADNGFPSDHTWVSFVFATSIYLFDKQFGKIAFILGLLVGISRVLAHVHSPIDIAGGILIGAASAFLAKEIASKYLAK